VDDGFIDAPAALIDGGAALFISRVLASPGVKKVLEHPPAWVGRGDITAAVRALYLAGKAFENTFTALERGNRTTSGAVAEQCWSTQRTADYLRISRRRAQELAPELDGKRIGRQWAIPAAAVRAYERQKAERATV
jgi:hypothetical protein